MSGRIRLVTATPAEIAPELIAEHISSISRSYTKNRVAIFTEFDRVKTFTRSSALVAEPLDPDYNMHWTGSDKGSGRRRKRVMAGDYIDWYCWYMLYKRFNSFPVLILDRPISRMLEDDLRGFIDGLLTRLVRKDLVRNIVILEEERFQPILSDWLLGTAVGQPPLPEFGLQQFREACLSLLYGSTTARNLFIDAARSTLCYKLNPGAEQTLQTMAYGSGYYIDHRRGRFLSLSEDGEAAVERLSVPENPRLVKDQSRRLIRQNPKRRHARPDEKWLQSLIETLLRKDGAFTLPRLYSYVDTRIERARDTMAPPKFLDPDVGNDYEAPNTTFLPSPAIHRRLVAGMLRDGRLKTTTWHKEIGRPATLYYQGDLPMGENRCGQCAFYISLRKQCRLWFLLSKSFGPQDPRWEAGGQHPLSWFELYKMRNSWRISPHSTACESFVDKKRDHSLKELPDQCTVCGQPLSPVPGNLVVCANCRTRYFVRKKGVKVLPAYEDRFQSAYTELAGHEPAGDLTKLHEEWRGAGFGALESLDYQDHREEESTESESVTLILFPGDRMLARDGRLFLLGRRRVESVPLRGATIVDQGVLGEEQAAELTQAGAVVRSIAKPPEVDSNVEVKYRLGQMVESAQQTRRDYRRILALAIAKSAIHATERIAPMSRMDESVTAPIIQEQRRFLARLEATPRDSFLPYEALIMKGYWKLYEMTLKVQHQRFGPRKKGRFVREHVTSTTGRARGYSAVHAAINYLHQRRLFKVMRANSTLGVSAYGEGFLHHKRQNAEGIGLLLDLVDPLKFADREKLLEAILNYTVNWRDFHAATDRQGMTFYYPKAEIIGTLEELSDEADEIPVAYAGESLPLMKAYGKSVVNLAESMNSGSSFTPFQF